MNNRTLSPERSFWSVMLSYEMLYGNGESVFFCLFFFFQRILYINGIPMDLIDVDGITMMIESRENICICPNVLTVIERENKLHLR